MNKNKIPTDGGQNLGHNPFGALDGLSLLAGIKPPEALVKLGGKAAKNRG
jgi:hypothetical protein